MKHFKQKHHLIIMLVFYFVNLLDITFGVVKGTSSSGVCLFNGECDSETEATGQIQFKNHAELSYTFRKNVLLLIT